MSPARTTLTALLVLGATLPAAAQFGGLRGLIDRAKDKKDSAVPAAKGKPAPSGGGLSAFPDPAPEPTEAFVVPSSIKIFASQVSCYMPKPGGDCKGTAWIPLMRFNLVGPIKQSTKVRVHYELNGKPWFKKDFSSIELQPNGVAEMSSEDNLKDEWARLNTGTVGFRITADDALAGTSKVLYQGTFKVGKHHTGNDHPNYKNQFEWFVDYDWALPLAHVDFGRGSGQQAFPPLEAHFWFKDPYESNQEFSAHLFYNGKEIEKAQGRSGWSIDSKTSFKQVRHAWSQWSFLFSRAIAHSRPEGGMSFDNAFVLARNPGDYEIKVLRGGELARVARFRILPNGKLDNSINTGNAVAGQWTIVPAKVLGEGDGTWNPETWKADLFWGHPLKGFALPQ